MVEVSGDEPSQADAFAQPPTDFSVLASQLKVWAEPKRLRILHLLMKGAQRNSGLGDALGMPPNLVSRHLFILREAGLIPVERGPDDARCVFHLLNHEALDGLNLTFAAFSDPSRIKPRRQASAPHKAIVGADSAMVTNS